MAWVPIVLIPKNETFFGSTHCENFRASSPSYLDRVDKGLNCSFKNENNLKIIIKRVSILEEQSIELLIKVRMVP